MRVLVTGISGNVGRAIATCLNNAGWQVVGAVELQRRFDLGSASFVEEVYGATSPCHAIVHVAASLDKDLYSPTISLTNCLGTQQILRLAEIWNTDRIVYISSIGVIGTPRQLPVTEEHSVNPPTAYHASKLFGEHLMRLANEKGLSNVALRLTSPVGPNMSDSSILPIFVKNALYNRPLLLQGRGMRRQNYVDVHDVANAVKTCLCRDVTGIFNIAGKNSISNLGLAEACVRTLGSSSKIYFTGQPDSNDRINWEVSIDKAMKCLNYNPRYSIEESIRSIGCKYD